MNPEKRSRSVIAVLYCLVQMLYWSSGFTTIGYATAYLGRIGFSNSSIGLITAVAGVTGFALVFCLSVWIDRAGTAPLYCAIAGILLLQMLLIAFFRTFQYAGPLPAVLYALFLSNGHAMNSLLSKQYMDLKKCGVNIDFGIARGLGSLAYAGSSFAIGYMLSHRPDVFVHYLTLAFYFLLLSVTLALQVLSRRLTLDKGSVSMPSVPGGEKSSLRFGSFFREYWFFIILVMGISLVSASNKTFTTFLVNVVKGVGGDTHSFTTITGFLALIEIPVMLFFSMIRRRYSISSMLMLSLILYSVKLGGAAAARSIPVLFAAVTAQTFAAGLYHPASVEFVREMIPSQDTAKCQALLDGTPVFVSFITITVFGAMLDSMPTGKVCFLLFSLAVLGTIISGIVMKMMKTKEHETAND